MASSAAFPPSGPTTLTASVPSYLYEQYADDADLQAFVSSFNALADYYAGWFATVSLPAYTQPPIQGNLLDWVALGYYGIERPALVTNRGKIDGVLGTYRFGTTTIATIKRIGPTAEAVTSDDVFKRIITWNFYKGDGDTFSIRWLKRRIARFLYGVDGAAPNVDDTYAISVTFGGSSVNIKIGGGSRRITGGALYGRLGFGNGAAYGQLRTVFVSGSNPPALAGTFKTAMDSGVLQVPFQYSFSVTVPSAGA